MDKSRFLISSLRKLSNFGGEKKVKRSLEDIEIVILKGEYPWCYAYDNSDTSGLKRLELC